MIMKDLEDYMNGAFAAQHKLDEIVIGTNGCESFMDTVVTAMPIINEMCRLLKKVSKCISKQAKEDLDREDYKVISNWIYICSLSSGDPGIGEVWEETLHELENLIS